MKENPEAASDMDGMFPQSGEILQASWWNQVLS
jgi:hypothetical protein